MSIRAVVIVEGELEHRLEFVDAAEFETWCDGFHAGMRASGASCAHGVYTREDLDAAYAGPSTRLAASEFLDGGFK
jgi:hypothetical protein